MCPSSACLCPILDQVLSTLGHALCLPVVLAVGVNSSCCLCLLLHSAVMHCSVCRCTALCCQQLCYFSPAAQRTCMQHAPLACIACSWIYDPSVCRVVAKLGRMCHSLAGTCYLLYCALQRGTAISFAAAGCSTLQSAAVHIPWTAS